MGRKLISHFFWRFALQIPKRHFSSSTSFSFSSCWWGTSVQTKHKNALDGKLSVERPEKTRKKRRRRRNFIFEQFQMNSFLANNFSNNFLLLFFLSFFSRAQIEICPRIRLLYISNKLASQSCCFTRTGGGENRQERRIKDSPGVNTESINSFVSQIFLLPLRENVPFPRN